MKPNFLEPFPETPTVKRVPESSKGPSPPDRFKRPREPDLKWLGDTSSISYQEALDKCSHVVNESGEKPPTPRRARSTSSVDTLTEEQLKEAFQRFDFDGDGAISFRDLCYSMEELGVKWE